MHRDVGHLSAETQQSPAAGPLHLLFPVPEVLYLQMFLYLLYRFSLFSSAIFLKRFFLPPDLKE